MDNYKKTLGKVYTPTNIVSLMLDFIGYKDNNILKKHIIDNSCGDGAFLCEIVKRYCDNFFKKSKNIDALKKELEMFIHGIEINEIEHKKCINNIENFLFSNYNISNIKLDITNADTLSIDKYNFKMDYCIGNPPYINVHNFNESYDKMKKFKFMQEGMSDSYIAFYEIGINMLNNNGKLCYITPNTIYTSVAGNAFRNYIYNNNLFASTINFEHTQLFSNATTYVCIMLLDKSKSHNKISYYTYNDDTNAIKFQYKIPYNKFMIDSNFFFSSVNELNEFRKIRNSTNGISKVTNGFATLSDKLFIGSDISNNSNYTIDVIKASSGKKQKCFFPYENGKLLPLSEIKEYDIKTYEFLKKHEQELKSRSISDKNKWYGFGREQGIKSVYENNFAMASLIKNLDSLKLYECPFNCGTYSGLYINTIFTYEELLEIFKSNTFISYIKLLGKYKNGGYYTYSSKDIEKFLHYCEKKKGGNPQCQ